MYHVFISDGRLLIHDDDGAIKELTSQFADQKMQEAETNKTHQGWKGKSSQDNPYWGSAVWGNQASTRTFTPFRFKNVMLADDNTIFYLITNNFMTGLFKYNIEVDEEIRLFHRNDFLENGIDYSIQLDQFVAAVVTEDGSVDLELLNSQGSFTKNLTGGDSCDSNPVFSRKNSNHVLYQSAGIARDEDGTHFAYSPESVNRIDIETGQITEVIADQEHDYLLPREDAHGNVYCIRRPYHGPGYRSIWQTCWHIITFPVQFVIAIFRFFDAFTKLFNQDWQTAGHNIKPPQKNKYIRVLGQTIDLAKIRRNSDSRQGPSLVPKSWELIKIENSGQVRVLAKKVSSYDINEQANVHFTNGFKVSVFSQDKAATIFKHNIVEDIKVAKVFDLQV
jgi:hypothetical protein